MLDSRSTPRSRASRFRPSPRSTLKLPPGIAMLAVVTRRLGLSTTAVPMRRRTGCPERLPSAPGSATMVTTLVRAESTPIRSVASSERRGRMLAACAEGWPSVEATRRSEAPKRNVRSIDIGTRSGSRARRLEDDEDAVVLGRADGNDGRILPGAAAVQIELVIDDLVVVALAGNRSVHDGIPRGGGSPRGAGHDG